MASIPARSALHQRFEGRIRYDEDMNLQRGFVYKSGSREGRCDAGRLLKLGNIPSHVPSVSTKDRPPHLRQEPNEPEHPLRLRALRHPARATNPGMSFALAWPTPRPHLARPTSTRKASSRPMTSITSSSPTTSSAAPHPSCPPVTPPISTTTGSSMMRIIKPSFSRTTNLFALESYEQSIHTHSYDHAGLENSRPRAF